MVFAFSRENKEQIICRTPLASKPFPKSSERTQVCTGKGPILHAIVEQFPE